MFNGTTAPGALIWPQEWGGYRLPKTADIGLKSFPQKYASAPSSPGAGKMRKESVNCLLRLDSLKCVLYQAAFQNCMEAKCGHHRPVVSSKPWSPIRVEAPALQTSHAARSGMRDCSAAGDRLAKKLELLHPEVALPVPVASANSHDRSCGTTRRILQDPDCPYQMTHRCN